MSLVGWWKLDGNADDSSGYGNHGTANGVSWVDGKIGQCGSFDGGYIEIPSSAFPSTNGSWQAWVYRDDWNEDNNNRIFCTRDSNGSDYEHRGYANFRWIFNNSDGSDGGSTDVGSLNDSEWNHLTFTWYYNPDNDSTVVKGYKNGDYINDGSTSGTLRVPDEYIEIGQWDSGDFPGKIDDVRIYDHALSPKEIKELSQAKVGHWKFDIESDTDAYDSSGNDNHGTVEGATWTSDSKIGSGCYDFDGTDDYIEVTDSLILKPLTGLTVSAWIKNEDATNNDELINYRINGSPYTLYWIRDNEGAVCLDDGTSDGTHYESNFDNVLPNEWTHVVMTFSKNDQEFRTYINGVLQSDIKSTGDYHLYYNHPDITNLYFGAAHSTLRNADCKIDDVRIYATALSESEIKEIYQQRASIDNKGNLYGHEFTEEDTDDYIGISNKGILSYDNFSEIGPMDGIVGYWPLDGDTNDYSGNGNDGTNNGATVTSGLGQSAYEFGGGGSGDIINCGDSSVLDITSETTWSAWVYVDESGRPSSRILEKNANNGYGILIDSSGSIKIEINKGGTYNWWEISNIQDYNNVWTHLAFVFDNNSGTASFYQDGVEIDSRSVSSDFDNSSGSSFNIGNWNGENRTFGGKIQDVRIYDRALSPEEINILYNITHPDEKQRVVQSSTGVIYTKGQIQEY